MACLYGFLGAYCWEVKQVEDSVVAQTATRALLIIIKYKI